MKKPVKKYLPLILFLIILGSLISGVFYYYLTGQPSAVSVEQMKRALASENLEPVDATQAALEKFPNAGLEDCIVAEQGDLRFAFYHFDNTRSSMEVYRQAHSRIITTRLAHPRVEISYGKLNYQVYTLEADGVYSVAICVGNTAIYADCDAENDTKLNRILDSIGYIDAVAAQTPPVRLMAVLRLLQFVLYIPLALLGRHWLWRAACRSAGAINKRLTRSKKTRKEQFGWMVENSPRRRITKTILLLYQCSLLPEYISVVLAIAGCFTVKLDGLLNVLGIVIPGVIFAMGLAGAFLSRNPPIKPD